MNRVNPHKIVGKHPYIDVDVTLQWYRGACRYNNGCTDYGKKYIFRLIIRRGKDKIKYPDVPELQLCISL